MPRILFITEHLPLPLNSGGNIRAYHLLQQAALRHEVTLATAAGSEGRELAAQLSEPRTSESGGRFPGVQVILADRIHKTRGRKLAEVAASVASASPYVSAMSHHNQSLREVIVFTVRQGFDLIHFDHLDAVIYRDAIGSLPYLLDEHNFETRLLKRFREKTRNGPLRVYLKLQENKLRRFEAAACQEASVVTAVSSEDAAALQELAPQARICVVPNGVDIEYFSERFGEIEPGAIVFTGSLDWLPNEEGVLWFLDDVFPQITKVIPGARFYVVGRNPTQRLTRLHDGKTVVVTGSVEDIRPYMSKAQVFVVPLLAGGGSRLKIVEAYALGAPVVSTTVGAEGIGAVHDRHLLIADDPEAFARQVVGLLQSPERREYLASNARTLARERFDWNVIGQRLEEAYQKAMVNGFR